MKCYIAITSRQTYQSSLTACLSWSKQMVASNKAQIVKIVKIRPNEAHGIICYDVTQEAITPVNGRLIPKRRLKAMLNG
jgi:hypothetical protein